MYLNVKNLFCQILHITVGDVFSIHAWKLIYNVALKDLFCINVHVRLKLMLEGQM